jgi:hypothetical protein
MSQFASRNLGWAVACWAIFAVGCAPWRQSGPMLDNPLAIPASDCDVVWNQIVDVVDDAFDIESEQRVRRVGDVLTVGRIDTVPTTGSSWFEFWKKDAADFYERTHNTLQTIRRRAVVQVIPAGDLFQVEVIVFKELEDLPMAQSSTAGSATFRNDGSMIRIEEPVGVQPYTLGWIPLGRDTALEQRMLRQMADRLLPVGGMAVVKNWTAPWFGGGDEPLAPTDGTSLKPPVEIVPAPPGSSSTPPVIPGAKDL